MLNKAKYLTTRRIKLSNMEKIKFYNKVELYSFTLTQKILSKIMVAA